MNNWRTEQQLLLRSDKLLLAVSGGVDSVVLCELCKRGGYSFAIAHANFQLRGEESNADEKFVRQLAEKYEVEIFVKRFDTKQYAEENKLSIQVAARELRYQWFRELLSPADRSTFREAKREGGQPHFDKLLTAHHRDDNIETVLMNFFRGTGISGLHGILPVKDKVVRPLLKYSKEEIIAFAKENNLDWREDSSNSSDKYSRNYFRQTIIPLVKNIFPEAEQNISANIERFREIEILYNQAIALHKKKLVEFKGKEIHIPVLKLKKVNSLSTIVYEIVKEYNFTAHQVPDIINLLDAAQGKYVQSATHRIIKNRNWLIISSKAQTESEMIIIEEGEESIVFGGGSVSIGYVKDKQEKDNREYLDASLIKYPLILRKWKQGDYFYPLGMHKKKKVSRFLIDNKISPTRKENTWVLETDRRICWIVGMRIDDRFKIKEDTKQLISLSLIPSC